MRSFSSCVSFAGRFAPLAICLAALGCGKSEPVGTVRGKVIYKGNPVKSGAVVFFPEKGPVSSGDLASDGTFQVLNFEKEEGVPIGEYSIAVIAGMDQIRLGPGVEPTVPLKYTSKSTSPLKFDVQEGENEIAISLDDPPSVKTVGTNL